ncbi:MAG: cell division protein SepF [Clostridia bacterium]|nr:cell division protein SepF [Clostridia bacterium]
MGEDSWVSKLSNKFEDLGRRFVVDDDGEVRDSAEENTIDEDVIRVLRTGVYDEPEEEETEDRDAEATVSRDDDNEESAPRQGWFRSLFGIRRERDYDNDSDAERSNGDMAKIIKPKDTSDGLNIVDTIKEGSYAIVNLELLSNEEKRLIFAFIHGAVYCLGGDIKRISEDVYVAGKAGLEIAGDFAEAAG